jgi:opacity protein-like surface antigen
MKTKMKQLLTATILLTAAPRLLAQDDVKGFDAGEFLKPYISIGQNFAHGHGHDLTQTTWGGIGAYTVEAGVQFAFNPQGVYVRPNIGYARILGDYDEEKPTYDLFAINVGFDIVYQPPSWGKFSATLGPSFHFWSVEEVNYPGSAQRGARAGKFGWRLGLGYDVIPNLRVDLTYTIAEWRSRTDLPYNPGFNPSLPAYFTLKASYRL